MFMKICLFLCLFVCCYGQSAIAPPTTTAEPPQEELFMYADGNKDDRLNSTECRNFWLRFDGDHDHKVDKLEFELKWTFLDLNDADHAGFFFRELDINLDGQASVSEINRMCKYMDDDNNGYVSKMEFQMNWVALFTFPHSA